MGKKRILTSILLLCTSGMCLSQSFAQNIWDDLNSANAYEAQGHLDLAAPLWEKSLDYFDDLTDESSLTNAAIMAKKLGQYHDSLKNYTDAVKYYEIENAFWTRLGLDWGTGDMVRANEIRSYIHYYIETDIPNAVLEKFEPQSGIYLGIYSENDKKIGQKIDKTQSVYGKKHAIYMYYQDFNQWMPSYTGVGNTAMDSVNAKRVEEQHGALQVAMNAMSGLSIVERNDWLVSWAQEASAYDMPIFLRFCGEMNGDWVPWHGDPTLYIEKFRLVHDIMEEYAPNVAMVWCPNDVPVELNGQTIDDYYPGDAYVDWVGVNFYVDYYDSGMTDLDNNYLQNPLTHLQYIYDNYAQRKPIMICETGVAHYSIPNDEDVTLWAAANLEKLYSTLPVVYPRVKAITYLSLNQANENYLVGNRWSNYALSENDVIEDTYMRIIQSNRFLDHVDKHVNQKTASVSVYEKTDTSALLSGKNVYMDIKIPDYTVSKVNVFSDTGFTDVQTALPFILNASALEGHYVNIQVFDSNGKIVMNEVIDLDTLRQQADETSR